MKKITWAVALALLSIALLAGCHNTGRQFRKMWDGIHDLLLEGTD